MNLFTEINNQANELKAKKKHVLDLWFNTYTKHGEDLKNANRSIVYYEKTYMCFPDINCYLSRDERFRLSLTFKGERLTFGVSHFNSTGLKSDNVVQEISITAPDDVLNKAMETALQEYVKYVLGVN